MFGRLQIRSATASEWSGLNPTLAQGEIGHIQPDTPGDPYSLKIGDGATSWNDLPTITGGGGGGDIEAWSDIEALTGFPDAFPTTSDEIQDATTVGVNLLTASSQANARSAIGAGTSNLALGTTSSTAKAGDWEPTPAVALIYYDTGTSQWIDDEGDPIASRPDAKRVIAAGGTTQPGFLVLGDVWVEDES